MKVKYSDELKRFPGDYELLEQATRILQDVIGESVVSVSAEWGRDGDGRKPYTLTISDFTDTVSVTFAPDELRSPKQVRSRLRELWGDLLEVHSDKRLKKLQQIIAEGE